MNMRRSKYKSGSQKPPKLKPRPTLPEDPRSDDAQGTDPMLIDSAESSTHAGSSAQNTPADEVEAAKRPRACESCRGLKVRCDFPADAESCRRCARAKRRCVVSLPNPRRPRRAESKVLDLERQVQDLTTALARQRGQLSSSSSTPADWLRDMRSDVFSADGTPNTWVSSFPASSPQYSALMGMPSFASPQGLMQNVVALAPNVLVDPSDMEFTDVIDRGVLLKDEAVSLFDHYKTRMMPWFPLVALDDQTSAMLIRRTKPVLFLAILAVASAYFPSDKQNVLMRETLKNVAWHVICRGEKSIELIQAMHVLSLWHVSDDTTDTTAFQFAHLASSIAAAMRLNTFGEREATNFQTVPSSPPDPTNPMQTLENAQAWLGCYILNGITFLKQRQQNTIRWSSHLEECIARLQAVGPTGYRLCRAAEIQHVTDRILDLWLNHTAPEDASRTEQEAQLLLVELDSIEESVIDEPASLLLLDIYEATVHARTVIMRLNKPPTPPPFHQSDRSSPRISFSQSEALKACIGSIHQLLDHFATILQQHPPQSLSSIPPYHFNRIINSLITLISFHYSALAPGSLVSSFLSDPDRDLRVEGHITTLVTSLHEATSGRAVQRFQMLLKMIRTWFARSSRSSFRSSCAVPQNITRARQHTSRLEPQPPMDPSPRMSYRKLSLRGTDIDYLSVGTGSEGSGVHVPGSAYDPYSTKQPILPHPGTLQYAATWPQAAPGQLTSPEEFADIDLDASSTFDITLDPSALGFSPGLGGNADTFG